MRRENNVLKSDITQIRTDNDEMNNEIIQQKDKIEQLTTLLDFKSSEVVQLKTENKQLSIENQQLKVSYWPRITRALHVYS